MISVVGLCNRALARLGAAPIIALDEVSKAARLCADQYPAARDAVLRAHPWNCAIARTVPGQLADAPAFGARHAFHLPADCVRALTIEPADAAWRVEGQHLLCDAAPVRLVYVRRIDDPAMFDPLLAEAIVARLAAEIAFPLAASASLAEAMWQLYEHKLREARGIDAQEGTPATAIVATWLQARRA